MIRCILNCRTHSFVYIAMNRVSYKKFRFFLLAPVIVFATNFGTTYIESDCAASSPSTSSGSYHRDSSEYPDIVKLRPKGEGFNRIDETMLSSKEYSWWVAKNLVHETLQGPGKIEV